MLKCFSIGRKIGTKMTMISVHSSGQPSTKMIACDRIMNCIGVRLSDSTQLLDQRLAAEDGEHAGEQRRADEQPAHHRGGLGGEEHRFLGALPVERAGLEGEQEGAGGADARRIRSRW